MRSRWNLPVCLGYLVASGLVAAFLLVQMGGEFALQGAYHLRAAFVSASELVPGDDVTLSGLRVGKIDRVEPAAGGAVVTMLVHQQYAPFFGDAHAVVKSKNLLGERYVELNRGTAGAGAMPDGATIPLSQTLTPVEVDQVLNALGPDVRDRLTTLLNSVGTGLAGQGQNLNLQAGDLKVLAQALQGIAQSLAASQADLSGLLISLDKVMQTLAAWHSEFRALIGNWDHLMQVLASHEKSLTGTVAEQDRVLGMLNQAFAGGADQSLNAAIAEAPATLTNASRYIDTSNGVFGPVSGESRDIARLFFELASVMSYRDASGRHHWRIYNVFTCDAPSIPVPSSPAGTNVCAAVGGAKP